MKIARRNKRTSGEVPHHAATPEDRQRWLGPLRALVADSFAADMAMHLTVVAFPAPLIAAGLAGSRFDPSIARPAWFAALTASLLERLVV